MDRALGETPSEAIANRAQDGAAGTPWVFGYGSLMWKPGFTFEQSCHARLHGYHRSLCVYSWVHRGTQEHPGLVFGLDNGGACKGIAFRFQPEQEEDVLAYLDARELVTDVYQRKRLTIQTEEGRVPAWCYVVRRDHAQYAGKLSVTELLARVEKSQGRSGHNRDYVLSTVSHLKQLGVDDAILDRLAHMLHTSAT